MNKHKGKTIFKLYKGSKKNNQLVKKVVVRFSDKDKCSPTTDIIPLLLRPCPSPNIVISGPDMKLSVFENCTFVDYEIVRKTLSLQDWFIRKCNQTIGMMTTS